MQVVSVVESSSESKGIVIVSELMIFFSRSSGDSPGSKIIAKVEPVILKSLSFLFNIDESLSAAVFKRKSPAFIPYKSFMCLKSSSSIQARVKDFFNSICSLSTFT